MKKIRKFYDKNLDKKILKQKIRKYETPGVYAYQLELKKEIRLKNYWIKKIETKIWNDPLISESTSL